MEESEGEEKSSGSSERTKSKINGGRINKVTKGSRRSWKRHSRGRE